MLITKYNQCIACSGQQLSKYLSLGESALANAYLESKDLTKPELKVPLEVYYCHNCHLSQLSHIVDRNVLFREYAYFSSTSPQLLKHFDDYAEEVTTKFPEQSKGLVFEIASNDGILLKAFKSRGAKVLGIDPAKNITKAANKEGIPTISKFFGVVTALEIKKIHGYANVITANNVLAHTDKLNDIIAGVKLLLDSKGVFIFQVKYLGDLLKKNEFDTIYHEHVSYFSLLPLISLLKRHLLKIFDVKWVETEGGSLRVFASHVDTPFSFSASNSPSRILKQERIAGLHRFETYLKFAKRPQMVKVKLCEILKELKQQGKKIAGYGASAKGSTLLQYCGIGSEILNYITDNAPSKQGKYTPGTYIPIVPPEKLKSETPDYILLLAWNYAESILEKERWFREQGGKFIIPIPNPRIV